MTPGPTPHDGPRSGLWPAATIVAIGLVAYTDWRVVTNLSVGYLYVIPLVLAATSIRHPAWPWCFVVVAATLREAFGPFEHAGWPLLVRSLVVTSVFGFVVFWMRRHHTHRQELTELVDRHRQQLSQDLEDAAALQRLLVPARLPRVPGWDVAARLFPARVVAGDSFDVIWDEPRQELVVVIADVAGKGAAAAMLMPVVQMMVRRLRAEGRSVSELAAALNESVVGLTEQPRFISLFYGVLSVSTGELTYVNLGHPPPVLISAGPGPHQWLTTGGPIAGAVSQARYATGHVPVGPGDMLILYTDGVTEAENEAGEFFGEPGIVRVVEAQRGATAAELVDRLHAAVESYRADPSRRDDVTLIVVSRPIP